MENAAIITLAVLGICQNSNSRKTAQRTLGLKCGVKTESAGQHLCMEQGAQKKAGAWVHLLLTPTRAVKLPEAPHSVDELFFVELITSECKT